MPGLGEVANFFPWLLQASVFRSITLQFSIVKEFSESGETKGGVGKDEGLKTPVESKFLCPVP